MKRGRPSKYTQALAAELCRRIAENEPPRCSLRSVCSESDMPTMSTVERWLADPTRDDFREQYAQAANRRADNLAEDVMQVAYGDDDPARARVKMDALKWFAEKTHPKKYGQRAALEHSGPDGGPIKSEQSIDLKRLSDEELASLAGILDKLAS